MYQQERKTRILELLAAFSSVSVNDLADRLHTSRETIRRDLKAMESEGLCVRSHGGAYLPKNDLPQETAENTAAARPVLGSEDPFHVRIGRYEAEKRAIARRAAACIRDKDTVFIDNSTTTLFIPDYIAPDLHVVIITNSFQLLMHGAGLGNPNLSFISLAGLYNSSNYSVYGAPAVQSAGQFFPDRAFISCSGISPVRGLTDTSFYEVDIRLAMIRKSSETFLLADHSKLTSNGPFYLGDIDLVDCLITDSCDEQSPEGQAIRQIQARHKIRVITVPAVRS